MRGVVILSIFALVLSCQGIHPVPEPENLIEKETLENIIYDMTLIKAARGYNPQVFSKTGIDPECHVFEKYEIDSAQYAQNTLYYSSSLDEYKELIDRVRKRVEEKYKVIDSVYQEDKRVKDSIRNAKGVRLKAEKDSIGKEKPPRGIPARKAIEPPIL